MQQNIQKNIPLHPKAKTQYTSISIIGLGYVGLPLLLALDKYAKVTGFDIDNKKIEKLKQGIDETNDNDIAALRECKAYFTSKEADIASSTIKIVTVPTPINKQHHPDLSLLKKATRMLAKHINKHDIVVYESTVYPGVTEEICAPIIEQISGLKYNHDFYLGYSPERLSPGNHEHALHNVVKIVSASTPEISDILVSIYGQVVTAGIYQAPSIKVAEAAKVIENTQRDLNIALMNECSIIFNTLNINTLDVIDAAATKWNFMKITPGLVGGHCIGVDPYYLTYKAKEIGYHPEVILAGRRINDGMGPYVAKQVVKRIIQADIRVRKANVGIFGLTFKEDVSDIRNSKVMDIIQELHEYDIITHVHDPLAKQDVVKQEYGLLLTAFDDMKNLDAIILAVPHQIYKQRSLSDFLATIKHQQKVVMDIKRLFHPLADTPNILYDTL